MAEEPLIPIPAGYQDREYQADHSRDQDEGIRGDSMNRECQPDQRDGSSRYDDHRQTQENRETSVGQHTDPAHDNEYEVVGKVLPNPTTWDAR